MWSTETERERVILYFKVKMREPMNACHVYYFLKENSCQI